MQIGTDVNRVRRLTAQKEDENWGFRSFLKCGKGMTYEEEDWVDEDATSHRGPDD